MWCACCVQVNSDLYLGPHAETPAAQTSVRGSDELGKQHHPRVLQCPHHESKAQGITDACGAFFRSIVSPQLRRMARQWWAQMKHERRKIPQEHSSQALLPLGRLCCPPSSKEAEEGMPAPPPADCFETSQILTRSGVVRKEHCVCMQGRPDAPQTKEGPSARKRRKPEDFKTTSTDLMQV